MHANELEALKPGPGLILPSVPETTAAAEKVEAARAALAAERDAVLRTMNERRRRQEIGVDCAGREASEWRAFQAGPLRTFQAIRGNAAGRVLLLCDERLAAEAANIRQREAGIAKGLGKLLGDAQAGADLGLLLLRFTGGLPVDGQLRTARDGWRNVAEHSRRALVELPPMPEPKPTASDNAEALKTMIEKAAPR